ncbi:MAG TPA: glycosyltransferase family 4 protein, partial [Solirubrobacteraceae bacterium]
MRVLIFHGYLLRGTGSNVYNASLAAALVRAGHEVHLLCQDRAPLELDWVDAAGDWDGGTLQVQARGGAGAPRATVYRPAIGGLLPVYVADRYEGVEARPFQDLTDGELDAYLAANVAAVREVCERARPDVALANHLVMGPAILARALADTGVPYAVKIHGSALEYTVKPHPRFAPYAREGLAAAGGILTGSRHTAESLWAAMDDPALPDRTRLGPPGVDVERFVPRAPAAAAAGLRGLAERLQG